MNAPASGSVVEKYYRFHSRIYDATRWSFLFGRDATLDEVARAGAKPRRILEVGCGTGKNLANLCARFPEAAVVGVDLSAAMLARATEKIARFGPRARLVQRAYDAPLATEEPFDLVLFSYALSMFNPGFEVAIEAAHAQLADDGQIAVVDFHATRWPLFERWMGVNHVRMNGQLRPLLRAHFLPQVDEVRAAYGGAWSYLVFVGRKSEASANRAITAG